jgi:hypothetical protein
VTITFPPSCQTLPLFYESAGRKWVRFIPPTNFEKNYEFPDDTKLLGIEDLLK